MGFRKTFLAKIAFVAVLLACIYGCEPVSVSVNSKGDIAFTRSEGIFFYDAKAGKISTVSWNYGSPQVPIIVRWSPDGENLAYTAKANKDEQNTEIYIIKKAGGTPKKIYAAPKIITQLEWSPSGKYLSVAVQGGDTELGVADLAIVSVDDGMSKTIVENCGDVHAWIDDKSIALVKVSGKHGESSDVLNGKLSIYKLDGGQLQALVDLTVTKTGGLDANGATKQIAFTALQTGPDSLLAIPSQIDKTVVESQIIPKLYGDDQKAQFDAGYALSKGSYKLKPGLDKETEGKVHDVLVASGWLNTDKPKCFVLKPADGKVEQISETTINFVQYSPDGASLLVKAKINDRWELGMIGLPAKAYKTLANDVVDSISANSGSVQAYPTWAGNASALYFRESPVYGSNGQSLNLMSVDTASLKKRNLQSGIDMEVAKLVEAKGGY